MASFLGNPPMNLIPASVAENELRVNGHALRLPASYGSERRVVVGVRPTAIRLDGEGMPAQVYLTEQLGDSVIVDLDLGGTMVRAKLAQKIRLAEGARVNLRFEPADVHLFDAETRKRI